MTENDSFGQFLSNSIWHFIFAKVNVVKPNSEVGGSWSVQCLDKDENIS